MARRKKGTPEGQHPQAHDLVDRLIAAHGGDVAAALRTLQAEMVPRITLAMESHIEDAASLEAFRARPRPDSPATFRVRIDIDGARPPIWRRLDLAGELTLAQVHRAIQAAFFWQDSHLHAFTPEVEGMRDGAAASFANNGLDRDAGAPDEDDVRLDEVVSDVGDRLFYTYDFGDSWEHTLVVEEVRDRGRGRSAGCLGGRRAAPMEDSGGIWRYNEIAAALAGKESALDAEELAEVQEWMGGDFDPADADLDDMKDLDSVVSQRPRTGYLYSQVAVVGEPVAGVEGSDPSRGGSSEALIGNPRLALALAQLAERAEVGEVLDVLEDLVAAAHLDITGLPLGAPRATVLASLPRAEAEATTAPWRTLVRAVGRAGVDVTDDGVVHSASLAADDSLFSGERIETANALVRTELVPAGVALGLLRKKSGRVFATRAGVDAAADPVRMWRHLADRLTQGVPGDVRIVSALALLVVAGEEPARETFADLAPRLLPWLDVHGARMTALTAADALAWARTVWTVIEATDGFADDGRSVEASRRLARAALLTS